MGAFRVEVTSRPAVVDVQSVLKTPAVAGYFAGYFENTLRLFQQLPSILVALLTPASLAVLAMGLWRVSTDLDWAGAFPITSGFFSHWQVWIASSIALKMLSSSLLAWDRRTRKVS
jgi:hypothetical protein